MRSVLILAALVMSLAAGATSAPPCLKNGGVLNINNQQVIDWKHNSKNEYHDRAHIQGKVRQVYPDHSGHHHFQVEITGQTSDTVEVIYNEDFGKVPQLYNGDAIEACGDYITSNAPSGGYPVSPDGALVHWVHRSPKPTHESGFLIVNGVVTGQN